MDISAGFLEQLVGFLEGHLTPHDVVVKFIGVVFDQVDVVESALCIIECDIIIWAAGITNDLDTFKTCPLFTDVGHAAVGAENSVARIEGVSQTSMRVTDCVRYFACHNVLKSKCAGPALLGLLCKDELIPYYWSTYRLHRVQLLTSTSRSLMCLQFAAKATIVT